MLELRNSERYMLKRCPKQWYWSIVEGLEPLRAANPLWFGTAVHEALAQWYQPGLTRGEHPAEVFAKVLAGDRKFIVTNEEEEAEYTDARELGVDMLTRYVERFGTDDSWFVIATEKTFQVRLPRPAMNIMGQKLPKKSGWLRYVGTWDGVYRDLDTGECKLMEHKTAASIRVDHLPLDDQAGSYWAVASSLLQKEGVLKPNEEIAAIEYNFLRKALRDERPQNERGEYLNKPTKKEHYITAIERELATMPSKKGGSWLGPGLTGKETMAQLVDIANKMEIEVHGEVSKTQPPPFFERIPVYRSQGERKTMIRRIQEEAIFSEAYRNGWLPVYKTPGKDTCTFCAFNLICQLDEQGDQQSVEEFKQTQYRVRDPYEDHKKDRKAA